MYRWVCPFFVLCFFCSVYGLNIWASFAALGWLCAKPSGVNLLLVLGYQGYSSDKAFQWVFKMLCYIIFCSEAIYVSNRVTKLATHPPDPRSFSSGRPAAEWNQTNDYGDIMDEVESFPVLASIFGTNSSTAGVFPILITSIYIYCNPKGFQFVALPKGLVVIWVLLAPHCCDQLDEFTMDIHGSEEPYLLSLCR